MGTRGTWGFHYDGEDKLTYNHYDSYPSGLGDNIKKFVTNHTVAELKEMASKIQLVTEDDKPTEAQIQECQKWADEGVSTGKLTEWYVLLREAQFEPEAYTELRYMISNPDFIKDSLFCEWGYIINLDTGKLEIYKGFQKRSEKNRYYKKAEKPFEASDSKYGNCRLLYAIPLSEVNNVDMEAIEKGKLTEFEPELTDLE